MRRLLFLLAMTAAGCASQPSAQLQAAAPPASAAKPDQTIEEQRLAAAKNLNMKVVDKDGQQLFCRSNLVTGSHIQRDVTCYTADQLDHLQAQTERDLNRLETMPAQNQGLPGHL